MIFELFFFIIIKISIFGILIITSFKLNYFKSIKSRVFLNYLLSIIVSNFIIINNYEDYNFENLILSDFNFFLLILLFNIYFPLLIDRSFSILILLILFKEDQDKKKLSDFIKNNFEKFVNRRIKYLKSNKFIKIKNKNYTLARKGKLLCYIYKLFKKIFNIKNNSII